MSAGAGPQVALRSRWAEFFSPSGPANGFNDAIGCEFILNKYSGSNELPYVSSNLPSIKNLKIGFVLQFQYLMFYPDVI
jgi:hypothetical protein